jgi:antitoxin component YwqK of YwqJK toxin-antitoxin module
VISIFIISLLASQTASKPPFTCGEKKTVMRTYGSVELRVDCSEVREYNLITVIEYKGKKQHGFQLGFDGRWHKRDSSFFVDGKENGDALFWDSLGNVVGKESFLDGKHIGKLESFYTPGRPSLFKNYNAKGEEEGPWKEWWPNGNPKADFVAKGGEIVSGTEFYSNGKPRIRFTSKYPSEAGSGVRGNYLDCAAWAPNGKPAGTIVKGNGQWLLFPNGEDSTNHDVFREVYKNTALVKATKLAPSEAAKWLKR